MNSRIKKVQSLLSDYNIDALIVTKDVNVTYLSQIPSSESWMLITQKSAVYLTDFRYIQEVRGSLRNIRAVQYKKSFFDSVLELATRQNVKRIGINENQWSISRFKILKKYCPKAIKLCPANDVVESLREVKTPNEIRLVKAGLSIHQQALKYIKKYIKPNTTEREVFKRLQQFIWRKDVGFSFDPIVASGPNSSFPHANVTTRKIRNNEPVLLDMGIDLKGYKTDLTRMFFLGKISNPVNEINAYVREAQLRAIQKIQDGVEIASVDLEARKYLQSKKLEKYFGHALGHGVGLEIHEGPGIHKSNHKPLKAGMIITVEPAVYLPNKFGIRLEEMVLVKKKGCEVISGHIN